MDLARCGCIISAVRLLTKLLLPQLHFQLHFATEVTNFGCFNNTFFAVKHYNLLHDAEFCLGGGDTHSGGSTVGEVGVTIPENNSR